MNYTYHNIYGTFPQKLRHFYLKSICKKHFENIKSGENVNKLPKA